jgi:8-oxo-dGTP pyrophosphatase MutT (NUDIX family)
MTANPDQITEQEIADRLTVGLHQPRPFAYRERDNPADLVLLELKPAAVLVPLLRQGSAWHLLYTRRNSDLPEHSNQVAFPGGRTDPQDRSPEMTALREAQEEIGLQPRDVRVLGYLHEYVTITNYRVTPVVGVMSWPYQFMIERREVSRTFTIPLVWLADPLNFDLVAHELPAPNPPIYVIYYHEYDGEILWGATARITQAFLYTLGSIK